LYASFMPKPILNAPGSGLHINLSISENEKNIFKHASSGEHSKIAESFIAGILAKTPEITLFLNPLANSYERFGKFEAPQYVSWSHQNRSQLIRIPASDGEHVRMELRSPDPSLNPYFAFALIISAGLDGIESNAVLGPAIDEDLHTVSQSVKKSLTRLPESFEKAIALAEQSDFVKNTLGEYLFSKYIAFKKTEAADFAAAKDKAEFYKERYFNTI